MKTYVFQREHSWAPPPPPLTKVSLTSETRQLLCPAFSSLSTLVIALGLELLLPLLLKPTPPPPPRLNLTWGVGPQTAMKDTFIAHMLFF